MEEPTDQDPKELPPKPPESPEEGDSTANGTGIEPPVEPKGGLRLLFRQLTFILGLIFGSLKELFFKIINIKHTTDAEGTIRRIKSGIEVRGYNIWILVASAVLACIGLDQGSDAVIIGAMLISPLMSPILGVGLSVGINDRDTLRKSLYNFMIAVVVSLLASWVYFFISPTVHVNDQILARTRPNVLDVGIAFFGGVAGIVAGSRKDITNAIPGVAIATALMPPVCVAGYGLAKFNMAYFAGAFYLFFLNAVFISLSTFLIVRYLDFPWKERISASLRKNFLTGVIAFVIVLLVPSVWLFIDLVREVNLNNRVDFFLEEKFGKDRIEFSVEEYALIKTDSVRYLRVSVASPVYLPEDSIALYQEELEPKYGLKNTKLLLIQSTADPNDRQQTLEQIRQERDAALEQFRKDRDLAFARQREIEELKGELEAVRNGEIPILEIRDDIRHWIPELKSVRYGLMRQTLIEDTVKSKNPATDAQVFVLSLTWGDSLDIAKAQDRKKLLRNRLLEKYQLKRVILEDVDEPFRQPEKPTEEGEG